MKLTKYLISIYGFTPIDKNTMNTWVLYSPNSVYLRVNFNTKTVESISPNKPILISETFTLESLLSFASNISELFEVKAKNNSGCIVWNNRFGYMLYSPTKISSVERTGIGHILCNNRDGTVTVKKLKTYFDWEDSFIYCSDLNEFLKRNVI